MSPQRAKERCLSNVGILFRIVSQREHLYDFVFSAFNCLKENKGKGIEGLNKDKDRAQRTKKKEDMSIEKSSTSVLI